MGASAHVSDVRRDALLRFLSKPSHDEARARHDAPGRRLGRARRALAVLLSRRPVRRLLSRMTMSSVESPALDREALVAWYQRNRARSSRLFDLLTDEAYYSRPIALRHPIVFYEGHLPAFSFNTLVKRALGRPSIDERLETLFARGIDPSEVGAATRSARDEWPSRDLVRQFAEESDRPRLD